MPSAGGCIVRTNVPFCVGAGDDRVERLADAIAEQQRRGRLAHRALDLVLGVLALGAALRRSPSSSSFE